MDFGLCRNSPYNLLADPADGESLYTRAFEVDEAGKQLLIGIAREVGRKENYVYRCSTCSEDGSIGKGFRATVSGTVTELGQGDRPPKLLVKAAAHSTGESLCPLELDEDGDSEVFGVDDVDDIEIAFDDSASQRIAGPSSLGMVALALVAMI